MIDFEQAIEAKKKADKEGKLYAEHHDHLTYQLFYENPLGKEWIGMYIGAMLQPITDEQKSDIRYFEGTMQPYKRIIESITKYQSRNGL